MTGGDSGNRLEGLRTIYYNPDAFNVLPYKHHYTQTNEEVLTGFFLPAFSIVKGEYMDSRGYTNPEKGREYYDVQRSRFTKSPKDLITYCAEYCYNAEEAFNLEGDNKFNKVNIAEQLV
nr:MAG TPA: Terminase large subunit [Caudoviricetes sp.]